LPPTHGGPERVIVIDKIVWVQFLSGFGKGQFRVRRHGGKRVLKQVRSFDARREHYPIQNDTDEAHQADFPRARKVLGPMSIRALKLETLKTGSYLVNEVLKVVIS